MSRRGDRLKLVNVMGVTIDIISIGALSRNVFWNETGAVRPSHATTTLIRDGSTSILVDPSLPAEVVRHRLDERAGLKPEQIDVVFLTSFRPAHRRGLALFEESTWLMGEVERTAMADSLNAVLEGGTKIVDDVSYEEVQAELEVLGRIEVSADKLTESVDFFPSYGATPGNSSLLIKAAKTIVVAGDAIVSRGHFDSGRVWDRSVDPTSAKESFVELCEIADVVVPGHDNIMLIG